MKTIKVQSNAVAEFLDLGVSFDSVEAKAVLERWAETAALITHPRGNRRYGDFVFKIECNQLQSVSLVDMRKGFCPDCFGVGFVQVYDVEQGVIQIPCQQCDNGVESAWRNRNSVRKYKNQNSRWAVSG